MGCYELLKYQFVFCSPAGRFADARHDSHNA